MSLVLVQRGIFDWHAGLEVALLAMRRAVDAGVSFEAVFAGDGPERERLLYTIHDLGLEARIRVVGTGVHRGADAEGAAFLWPALRADDLAPLRDAVERGVGVIASDLPESRWLVRHEEGGLLVPPRDPDALAEAIARFAREPGRFPAARAPTPTPDSPR